MYKKILFTCFLIMLSSSLFAYQSEELNDYERWVESRNYEDLLLPVTKTPMKEHSETALHYFNTNSHRAKDDMGREIPCEIVENCTYH